MLADREDTVHTGTWWWGGKGRTDHGVPWLLDLFIRNCCQSHFDFINFKEPWPDASGLGTQDHKLTPSQPVLPKWAGGSKLQGFSLQEPPSLESFLMDSPVSLSTLPSPSQWDPGDHQNASWSHSAAESKKGESQGVMDMALSVFSSSEGSIFRAILIQFI